MLRHFLGTLAYRTQKALRGAPADFANFDPGNKVRTPKELIRHMTPVDLLIIEGFKRHAHNKLEVYRRSVGKPLLCAEDARIVAVASDGPVPEARVPVIALDDTRAIADFIVAHCGLAPARARGAA
jgi:hypothetical protein